MTLQHFKSSLCAILKVPFLLVGPESSVSGEKKNLKCDDMRQGSQSGISACMPASWHTVTNKKKILCNDSRRSSYRCVSYFNALGWLEIFCIFSKKNTSEGFGCAFCPNVSLLLGGIVILKNCSKQRPAWHGSQRVRPSWFHIRMPCQHLKFVSDTICVHHWGKCSQKVISFLLQMIFTLCFCSSESGI